ncbi:MAG: HEAT repeat domain-containing protein [Deltaproteobacteria bacterium]|nr:HEAT repeat domain-containing protein [Deltaproteobacteria bacterium]
MHRILSTLVLALSILTPAAAAADETYFAFGAEQIETGGTKQFAFIPFAFRAPREGNLERRVAHIFTKIHEPRAAVYGDTYLFIKEAPGGAPEAWLTLDPAAAQFHNVIVGEIYLTLGNLGVDRLHVSPWDRWVTDADVVYPYFAPMFPVWEALPPARYFHSVVRLADGTYLASGDFYAKLDARDPALYQRIFDVLGGDVAYPKLRVLSSFGQLSIPDPAIHLIPLLKDRDTEVKYTAIEMLSKDSRPQVLDALGELADSDPDPEARLRAARILVDAGRGNFQIYILFEKLKSKDLTEVRDTVAKLGLSGDRRVLTALEGTLVHPDAGVRQASLDSILKLKDLETLKRILTRPEVEAGFREQAARALMAEPDRENCQVGIRYLLASPTDPSVLDAIDVLRMRTYGDMAPELVALYLHPSPGVATRAVEATAGLKLVDRIPDLAQAAKRTELVEAARGALSALMATLGLDEVVALAADRELVVRELALRAATPYVTDTAKRKTVLGLLYSALKDPDVTLRRSSALALRDTGDPEVLSKLVTAATDTDAQVRLTVTEGAAALGNEEGDQVLLALIDDPDDGVKLAVVKAIGVRKVKAAMEKLKFRVTHRDLEMRRAALRTIVSLNETPEDHKQFLQVYQSAIFDPDVEIKIAGLEGIQWINDPNVVALLTDGTLKFHPDPRVRAVTLLGLGRSRDFNVIEDVARGLALTEPPEVQRAAIQGLKLMGHKKGLQPLQEFVVAMEGEELAELARDAIQAIENPPKSLLDE